MFCNTLLEFVLFFMFLGPIHLSPSLSGIAWLGFGPTSGIPMGLGRSSSLRIGGDSSAVSGSGRTSGESNRLAVVVLRDAPREPPSPLGKGKDEIDEIKYPVGSKYLRSAVQNALAVGPSRVEPLYGEVFARRYRPPFGVQVWSLDVLTSYLFKCPRWCASSRWPLRMASVFLCIPLSKGFCIISTSAPLSFRPTSGVF